MQIAILDLGTNTFNLLIAETGDNKTLNIIHSSKQPVKLGKGGINKKLITRDAMKRGYKAIENHLETIKTFDVKKTYAYATSAIRDAGNSMEFIKNVKEKYKLYINIIPGEREAEMIYKGVRQSMQIGAEPVLILDIGGGSNEFIIANNKKIFWKQSYNLGMARMLEKFNPKDPISDEEVNEVETFLESSLVSLFEAVQLYEPTILIGAAGFFETFYALLSFLHPRRYKRTEKPVHEILHGDYIELHKKLLHSTVEDRKKMPGMELVRVEMIVLASIFVNFTLKKCRIHKVFQSDYSLKEGVIAEILNI